MTVLTIILGVLLIIASAVCLAHPLFTAIAIGVWLAIGLLCGGISDLVVNSRVKKSGWFIALDIVSIILGLVIIFSNFGALLATDMLITIMGCLILFDGIARIPLALALKKQGEKWGIVLASGILSIIAACMIISNYFTGLFVADIMFSSAILVQGITLIASAVAGQDN